MVSRDLWPSRTIFILVAVGTAAGLGNFWRFPMLAFEHGGGAFMLALILTNILIVYPLVMFETVLGQRFRAGAPKAMESLKPGTAWIQWIPLVANIFVMMYYVPVMAWTLTYLVHAFSGSFLQRPETYFATEILHLTAGIHEPGSIQTGILLALLVCYVLVFLCMSRGVHSVSTVVRWTATLPFLLLSILLVRGVTLPGAGAGLAALFIPKWSALLDARLWQEAIGQSFFSAGLAFGFYTMAGSHRPPRAEIPKTTIWVLAGNLTVSILAGISVFSTLGFMAQQQGVPLEEAAQGGPKLVFSVLPTAISMLPTFKIGFAVLLFLIVLTLAIDSIFGVMEAVVAGLSDLRRRTGKGLQTTVILLVFTFCGGIPITLGAGMYYLDVMDHYVGGYLFMLVGLIECAVAAYLVGPDKIRGWLNETAAGLSVGRWFNVLLYLIPIVLAILFCAAMVKEFKGPYEGYPPWAVLSLGVIPLIIISLSAWRFGKRTAALVGESVQGP